MIILILFIPESLMLNQHVNSFLTGCLFLFFYYFFIFAERRISIMNPHPTATA